MIIQIKIGPGLTWADVHAMAQSVGASINYRDGMYTLSRPTFAGRNDEKARALSHYRHMLEEIKNGQ